MSCSVTPRLLSYYSPKVNIYDSNCFIPLPTWRNCPAPPCIYIAPQLVYPPAGPYSQPKVCPVPQPLNPPGAYCGKVIAPCNTVCAHLGTEIPCNATCGTKPQSIGCPTCVGTAPSGCSSCR
jgi:hypothetical protein